MTSYDAHGNKHRPAGTSTGGQFDGHHRSEPEPGEELSTVPVARELTIEEIDQQAQERAEKAALRERWAEVRQVAGSTAGGITSAYRLDRSVADDIAQDVAVTMLASKTKTLEEQLAQPDTYIKQAVRNRATKQTVAYQHKRRSEDTAGLRALQLENEAFLEANGRRMNNTERTAAADRIRNSFPVGARPAADFHITRDTISLDMPIAEDMTLADVLPDDSEQVRHDEADRIAALALYELDSGTTSGKAKVRKSTWRIVSIRDGAPQVRESSLAKREAKKARDLVTSTPGGVVGLLDRWESGDASTDEEQILFSPFGDDLDIRACERVATVLRRRPALADRLYAEAVRVATR